MKTEYDEMIERNADVQTIDNLLIRKAELERELALVVKQLRALNVRWVGAKAQQSHFIKPRYARDTLRKAIECGPLAEALCKSSDLREFSGQWRKLIEDLRKPAAHPFHIEAAQALQALGVAYVDEGKKARKFYTF